MSTFLRDLVEVRPSSVLSYLMLTLSVVCPGVLVILAFRPGWLTTMDFGKLALIACSLSAPLVLLNWFALLVLDPESPRVVLTFPGLVSAGLAFLLLGGVAVARIFWSISVTQGLAGIIAAEVLVVTLLVSKARGAPSSGGAAP